MGRMPLLLTFFESKSQINDKPRIFILDTPGVTLPTIPDDYTGFKLAVTGKGQAPRLHCWVAPVGSIGRSYNT